MKFIAILLTALIAFTSSVFAISPINDGVIKCNNYPDNFSDQYQARWGYLNPTTESITEFIGGNNKFSGGVSENLGQPTTFISGRQVNVFRTPITVGQTLVWKLFNKTATATIPAVDKERVCF
jgi:hypothetical protein